MQLGLLTKNELRYAKSWSHGGVATKKRRKIKRPLIAGKKTHLIFKSSKAVGQKSFFTHKVFLNQLIRRLAHRHFVKIHQYINMGNHIHFKVSFKDSKEFQNFMRIFAALTARHITGAKKGEKKGPFWDGLAFTRVLHSSYEELVLKNYFYANVIEREHGETARQQTLKELNYFLKRLRSVRAVPQEKAREMYAMSEP